MSDSSPKRLVIYRKHITRDDKKFQKNSVIILFIVSITRIRHNYSYLNADLFRVNISANSNRRCGAVNANAHHYFLKCLLYVKQRNRIFSSINPLVNVHLKLITNENAALNTESNAVIHSTVLKYILSNNRNLTVAFNYFGTQNFLEI